MIARATSSAEKLACQGQYSFRGQQENGLKENTPWHPGHHLFVLAWFRSLDNRDPNIATRKQSSWRCDLPMRPKSTTRPKRTKQEQSRPTCSGFSARCSCRICMHTSGGRHLHWTQAVCAAHINVSVACEEHNMNTRQCHRHTSFLHHNKLMTSLDAAEECEETVFRRGHEWLHNS